MAAIDLPPTANAVLDTIRNRRSVSPLNMKTDSIPEEHLNLLLEAANWAPSHKHTEPWRFKLFTGAGRARLAQALGGIYRVFAGPAFDEKKYLKTVSRPEHVGAVMTIEMHPSERPLMPEFEEICAVACAVQNIHLTAQSLGIGGFWSSPAYLDSPEMRAFLGLEGRARCLGLFYLGYPEEDVWPRSVRKPVADKITRIED